MLWLFDLYSNYTADLQGPAKVALDVAALGILATAGSALFKVVTDSLDPAKSRSLPLPPGPPDGWFSPGPKAPIKYAELTEMYGPVFSFKQGKNIVCVIGRYQAAVDIMQKQGADLADRPRMIAASEIVSGGKRTLLTPAGERLKKLRRALHAKLQPSTSLEYLPLQFKNVKAHLLDIINDPEEHVNHARRYAASLIMTTTYGKTSPTYFTDPDVVEIALSGTRLGTITQTAYSHPVDVYPVLRHIPFMTSMLRQWHKEELDLFTRQVNGVKKQLEANTAQPSFVTYLLDHQEEFGLTDDELAYLAGSMFGAGSETTASAISFVVMAAATHPEEQRKVQKEIDVVIGHDRLPEWEDIESLPRVQAFFLETYRWRPTSWGGFAHKAMKDIIYKDYVIPAGATVVGNHWAIGLDPDVYPEPHRFKPDRWLDANGNLREDMTYFNFGFGRRVCPGQHVANNSLKINTTFLLWAFNISEDPSKPIDTMAFSDTANVRPDPFKAVFEPRIPNLKEMIEASMLQY